MSSITTVNCTNLYGFVHRYGLVQMYGFVQTPLKCCPCQIWIPDASVALRTMKLARETRLLAL